MGAFLNVHEGPQSISYKKRPYEEGLAPGTSSLPPFLPPSLATPPSLPCLNVHEGPQSISYKKRPFEEDLAPGTPSLPPSLPPFLSFTPPQCVQLVEPVKMTPICPHFGEKPRN